MSADVLGPYSEAIPRGASDGGRERTASDDQKLFVVLSVATATACFLVNAVVTLALLGRRFCLSTCRRRTPRSSSDRRFLTSDALHLSQAVAGLLASAASVYPIELIAIQEGHLGDGRASVTTPLENGNRRHPGSVPPIPPPDLSFFTSRTICYVLASAPLLSSVFASLGTNTLMALEQHLLLPALRPQSGSRDPGKVCCTFRCGLPILPLGLTAVWLITLAVSVLPILGPGSRWVGICVLPGTWENVFTAIVAALLLLLVLLPVYLYAGIFSRHRGSTPSIRSVDGGDSGEDRSGSSEEVPICDPPTSQCSDPDDYIPVLRVAPSFRRVKANFIHFCLLLVCYLPVTLHLLSRAGTPDISSGIGDIATLLERDATLPWAALLVVVAGVASPLVYLLVDDELPGLTVDIARAPLCECCWSTKKSVNHKPVSVDSDDDDVEEN